MLSHTSAFTPNGPSAITSSASRTFIMTKGVPGTATGVQTTTKQQLPSFKHPLDPLTPDEVRHGRPLIDVLSPTSGVSDCNFHPRSSPLVWLCGNIPLLALLSRRFVLSQLLFLRPRRKMCLPSLEFHSRPEQTPSPYL